MDFCSTFLLFGYCIFGTFWYVCGLLCGLGDLGWGDFGCAVFLVESTNANNLDLNKNLNLSIIEIEI